MDFNIAHLFFEGQYGEALSQLEEDGFSGPWASLRRAEALYELGRYQESLDCLNQDAFVGDDLCESKIIFALNLAALDQADQSLRLAEEVLSESYNIETLLRSRIALAQFLLQLGEINRSLEESQLAWREADAFWGREDLRALPILSTLALALAELGEPEKAQEIISRSLDIARSRDLFLHPSVLRLRVTALILGAKDPSLPSEIYHTLGQHPLLESLAQSKEVSSK